MSHQKNVNVETIHEPVKSYSSFTGVNGVTHNPLNETYCNTEKSAGFAQLHILRVCGSYYSARHQQSKRPVIVSERSILSPAPFIDAQNFSPFVSDYLMKELSLLQCAVFRCLPDHVIFLDASPELCFNRMRKRDRAEEEPVSLEYLRVVDSSLKAFFAERHNTFTIHVKEDFSTETVLSKVNDIIKSVCGDGFCL